MQELCGLIDVSVGATNPSGVVSICCPLVACCNVLCDGEISTFWVCTMNGGPGSLAGSGSAVGGES